MAGGLRPSHGRRPGLPLSDRAGPPAPLPWRSGAPASGPLGADFFRRPLRDVARSLLGARIRSSVDGILADGVIVEVEAYGGAEDAASHAATVRGRTERNRAMFGPAGRAYVYRSYGVHWCFNVVTGDRGDPQAVLVRGIEPLLGVEAMARRRGGREPLGAGPGRLCQALGITDALYGHDLREPPLVIAPGWPVPEALVGISGRVGVRAAADRPDRLYVRGSPGVSRPDGWRSPPPPENA